MEACADDHHRHRALRHLYAEVCARITLLAAYLVLTLDVLTLTALLQEIWG